MLKAWKEMEEKALQCEQVWNMKMLWNVQWLTGAFSLPHHSRILPPHSNRHRRCAHAHTFLSKVGGETPLRYFPVYRILSCFQAGDIGYLDEQIMALHTEIVELQRSPHARRQGELMENL